MPVAVESPVSGTFGVTVGTCVLVTVMLPADSLV